MTYAREQSRHLPTPRGGGGGWGGGDGTQEVLHPKKAGCPARQLWCTAGRRWQWGGHRLCHASPGESPFPYAPRKPGCPAPAGCVPISLPGTFVFGVLLCPVGMSP